MESLKALNQITEPDERNLSFVRLTSEGPKPRSLEFIYESVSSISLHDGVPEQVRNHFLQAQHLSIYAWYYYPFHTTVHLLSAIAVEYALKIRSGKEGLGLAKLIRLAINEGWIRDEGFSHVRPRREGEKPYVEVLIESFPGIRNNLGHGSSTMVTGSDGSVKIAAELINQLFPTKGNG